MVVENRTASRRHVDRWSGERLVSRKCSRLTHWNTGSDQLVRRTREEGSIVVDIFQFMDEQIVISAPTSYKDSSSSSVITISFSSGSCNLYLQFLQLNSAKK